MRQAAEQLRLRPSVEVTAQCGGGDGAREVPLCRARCRHRRARRPDPRRTDRAGAAGGSLAHLRPATRCTVDSPCARSCTEHWTGESGGGHPVQTGRTRRSRYRQRGGRADGDVLLTARWTARTGIAIRGGAIQAQSLALPDGEPVGAVVAASTVPSASRSCQALSLAAGQEALGVAVGDEADIVAVWLVRDKQAAIPRLFANPRLGRVTQREHLVADLSE